MSHVLQIDELRKGIQSIAGRSGDDDINASLPDPITPDNPGDPTVSTTQPLPKQAFSPTRRLKVWVGGDSLSITPGESFVNLAPGTEVMDVAEQLRRRPRRDRDSLDPRSSTGPTTCST